MDKSCCGSRRRKGKWTEGKRRNHECSRILGDEFAAVQHDVELAFGARLRFTLGQVKAIVAFLDYLWTEHDDDTAADILLEMGCSKGSSRNDG